MGKKVNASNLCRFKRIRKHFYIDANANETNHTKLMIKLNIANNRENVYCADLQNVLKT